MTTSKPLKWHGGKHYLAPQIIEALPDHVHYCEPYAGGLSVLFAKPIAAVHNYSEAVNDLNGHLTNFWRVLADPALFKDFERRVEGTPFSQDFWRESAWHFERSHLALKEPDVDDAVQFFILYRQSRQGLAKDFATMSRSRTRRGMNEQASSWWSAVEGLADAHERLKRVVIFNMPALEFIKRQDSPHTCFYLDPPYLHETRTTTADYACEMDEDDHAELLDLLTEIDAPFVLSGYHSTLYDNWAAGSCWGANGLLCVEVEIDNKASSKQQKDKKTECLWVSHGREVLCDAVR